ncbi:hypothetical protein A6A26_23785 (plasmid) [Pantoea sp. OXWO6B1]|nr:hypothetical protein A6A26_23785 [Pantoea sp. OXWO6B1]
MPKLVVEFALGVNFEDESRHGFQIDISMKAGYSTQVNFMARQTDSRRASVIALRYLLLVHSIAC